MSVTLYPSQEVHVIDVPEPDELSAEFHYNYFQVDESVSDVSDNTGEFEKVSFEERDSAYVKQATSRISRFVALSFKAAKLKASSRSDNQAAVEAVNKSTTNNKGLIVNNISKVMFEDDFTNSNFTAVSFYDGFLSKKMYLITSGTIANLSQMYGSTINNTSMFRSAKWLEAMTPSDVDAEVLYDSYVQPMLGLSLPSSETTSQEQQQGSLSDVNNAKVSVQINNKVLADLLEDAAADQFNLNRSDLLSSDLMTNVVRNALLRSELVSPNDEDYKSVLSYVDLIPAQGALDVKKAELVGYIIDKYEITATSNLIRHQPIMIEDPRKTETVDLRVKYGSYYMYTVRSVAQLLVPAYDDEKNVMYLAKVLLGSRETPPVYVSCVENVSPPSPVDVNFVWDYDKNNAVSNKFGSLMISWSFPVNTQRDIKRFQVFRRPNIDSPFELIKEYDFDDSTLKYDSGEKPDHSVVMKLKSPRTFYHDDDFQRTSKYIYALCSVDAHGHVSSYGEQFEVSFDLFKNKLIKKLVSYSGAPRQYPNLYVENDLFVDMMKVSGEHSKLMSVYFNPEYVGYLTDDDKYQKAFYTKQDNASYLLQIINVDNQKQQDIRITIDDPQNMTSNPESFSSNKTRRGRPRGL